MNEERTYFTRTARWLHWSMAAMILAMLFIGVAMVASLELRPWLLDLHRPLGLLVLMFVRPLAPQGLSRVLAGAAAVCLLLGCAVAGAAWVVPA